MNDPNEIRKALEQSLGEELMKKYFDLLKQWYRLSEPITKIQFESALRDLMTTEEQIRNHNNFMLAMFAKTYTVKTKTPRNTADKGVFEHADYTEYMQSSSSDQMPPAELEYRSAASELFIPDNTFIKTRIAIHAWENKLSIPDDGVTQLMLHACQTFVRNIITAMITRKEGYRIKDGKLQHAFGLPVPDPFIRNTNNIIDYTQDCSSNIGEDDFVPASQLSEENAEHQAAFSYSCGKMKTSDGKLSVQLLYDTIRENPRIVGLHSVHSTNLLKVGLHLDES